MNYKIKFNLFGVFCCFCYFYMESDVLFLYLLFLVELGFIFVVFLFGGVWVYFFNFWLVIEFRVLIYLMGKS